MLSDAFLLWIWGWRLINIVILVPRFLLTQSWVRRMHNLCSFFRMFKLYSSHFYLRQVDTFYLTFLSQFSFFYFLFFCRLLELQYKYGNLSKEDCKPGYSGAKMTSIYPKQVCVFVFWVPPPHSYCTSWLLLGADLLGRFKMLLH